MLIPVTTEYLFRSPNPGPFAGYVIIEGKAGFPVIETENGLEALVTARYADLAQRTYGPPYLAELVRLAGEEEIAIQQDLLARCLEEALGERLDAFLK